MREQMNEQTVIKLEGGYINVIFHIYFPSFTRNKSFYSFHKAGTQDWPTATELIHSVK